MLVSLLFHTYLRTVFWVSFVGFAVTRTHLAMKYDPSSNLVYGFLIMSPTSALPRRLSCLIKSGKFKCNHYLNLIACFSQLFLERMNGFINVIEENLFDVQETTGQHDFVGFEEEEADLSKIDYRSTTRTLNKTGTSLGQTKEILQILLSMFEKIREWDILVKSHISNMTEVGDSHKTEPLFTEKTNEWIENKLLYLKDYCS